MKAFGGLIASLLDRMGLRKVSSVSLLLLVSLPHAFHEVNTSPEQALVQPLCTHGQLGPTVPQGLSASFLCGSHAQESHKLLRW